MTAPARTPANAAARSDDRRSQRKLAYLLITPAVILMLAVGTGFTPDVARTSGFDACFSKIVDVGRLDRYIRDHLLLSRRPPRHASESR